jgi:GxxExxY protein
LALPDGELTERIIACAYRVHNTLGAGFLEKVYENAMAVELESEGIAFRRQVPLKVMYRDRVVGEYFADIAVEDRVICEFEAEDRLTASHELQLVNYLVATGIDTGLLINFGRSVEVRRKFRQFKNPVNPVKSCEILLILSIYHQPLQT